MKRGEHDRFGWKHIDIPVAICAKCEHRIYNDEKFSHRGFVGASGNNEREYMHEICPVHNETLVKTIYVYRCDECGMERTQDQNISS